HAYPYRYQVWAYSAHDLAAVKAGTKQPWEVQPYDIWELNLPYDGGGIYIGGAAYDAASGRLYVSQQHADAWGLPLVHAFQLPGSGSSDTQAPVLSSIASSSVSTGGATITWTTDEASDTQVEYGTTTSYGSSTTLNTSLVTSHSQVLSGLNPDTTYHYRVKSRDAAGNLATSGDFTFTTAATVDTTAPAADIIDISPDPRNASVDDVAITFSEVVTGVDLADFTLTRSGSSVSLSGATLSGSGANYTLNLSSVTGTSGNYVLTLVASGSGITDAAGNALSVNAADSWTTDMTAPAISGVTVSSITKSEASIGWTTNEVADTQVEYGTTTNYGTTTALDSVLVTNHFASLTGLSGGTTYHYRVKSRDALGNLSVSGDFTFTTASEAPSITDWGTIAFSNFSNLNLTGPDTWYSFNATRTGKGTVEAFFDHAAGDINLTIYDANLQSLGSSTSASNAERLDFNATGGAKYYVKLSGKNADVDVRVTNLVGIAGTDISVFGTPAADTFGFVHGASHQLSVNGVTYSFAPAELSQLTFSGDAGTDTLQVELGSLDDTVTLRPGVLDVTNAAYRLQGSSLETISVNAGSGLDKVWLYDTAGDDTLTASPSSAQFIGAGMNNTAAGFDEVRAFATAGGFDVAKLYDSSGNDFFDAGPASGSLRGTGFYSYAEQFDRVYAYSTAGGYDIARLYDSIGNDYFDAGPTSALLRGSTFYNWADRFDEVIAHSTAGGTDIANLYGSVGDDLFTITSNTGTLTGSGYSLTINKFEESKVYGQGGNDTAQFREVRSVDKVYGRNNYARLTVAGKKTTVFDFALVEGYAKAGQKPSANVRNVDYVFKKYGTWK
ncbi:MAG TPA: fibronectin type III domain-containing protein, partial [Pirellulaceae bacterium]|nr:fibronectin type III domain-containing protein [Pirellulaceae bacterium]